MIRSSSQSPGSGFGSEVVHTAAHYLSVPDSIARARQEEGSIKDAPRGAEMGSHPAEWAKLPPMRRPLRNRPRSASGFIIHNATGNI